jgi:hypothetical protein
MLTIEDIKKRNPDMPIIDARFPDYKSYSRPSVEHTGQGNDLFYTGFGGRWFRASPEWVRAGIDSVLTAYHTENCYINCNDFYEAWGIQQTDFGYTYGYSADDDYKFNGLDVSIDRFDFETNPHELVVLMREPVYILTPTEKPYDYYLEI